MKRHPALVRLSRDHYFGLLLAQQMKTGAAPYKGYPTDVEGKIRYLFQDYEEKLKPHFAAEENILFLLLLVEDMVQVIILDLNFLWKLSILIILAL